jgi:hypothetical protein
LDTLFTREEHQSLLFKSKKSDKPALDPARVEKILCKFTVFYLELLLTYLILSTQLASTKDTLTLTGI